MHCTGVHIDQVSRMNIDPVKQLFHPCLMDGTLYFRLGGAGLQPKTDLGSGFGAQHIPALCFSAGLPNASCAFIVRMHLYRELVAGEEKLDQEREANVFLWNLAEEVFPQLLADLCQGFPGQGTVADLAGISGKPGFANWG